jgi:hypothetical protein
MMTKVTTVQHVGSTLPFPGRHLMGVFGSWQEAEQAVRVLLDAGHHAEDIALIASQDFPSAFQEHVRKEGRFRHMMHQLQVTTDEESLGELFLAAAREGSHIISISVPQRGHRDEVSAILFNHGARLVKYIGHWSIEDLFPLDKKETVDAEASRGLGYEPESDDQQPGQALQQSDSTRSQDRGREQTGQVSGQLSGPTTGKDVDHAAEMTDSSEGTMQDEQEGQQMNIEQAHQTNTAQYTGKPGVKAPSPGQDPGTAYGYNMDL